MKRKHKGVLLLIPGILGLLTGLGFLIAGIFSFVKQFDTLTAVQSPGSVPVVIEEAGIHTLWHAYRTVHKGTPVRHAPELPPGFTYALVRTTDAKIFPLDPARAHSTLSTTSFDAVAVGSFYPDLPGAYTLQANHPAGESRVFSLTQGSLLKGIGRFAWHIVLTCMFSLAGLVMLVIGIVLLLTKPKATHQSSHLPS